MARVPAGCNVTSFVLKIMHSSVSKINCGHSQEKNASKLVLLVTVDLLRWPLLQISCELTSQSIQKEQDATGCNRMQQAKISSELRTPRTKPDIEDTRHRRKSCLFATSNRMDLQLFLILPHT